MNEVDMAALRRRGVMVQKDPGRFILRLGIIGGSCTAAMLRGAAELAERFGDGTVHLTTRQALEVQHIPEDRLPDALHAMEQMGLPKASSGPGLRTIVACPGHAVCRFARGDTQGIARRIHARFSTYAGLQTKLKIGICGCPNSCAKPQVNDIGIMAAGSKGYKLFIGGRIGRHPALATVLDAHARDEYSLMQFITCVFDWMARNGGPKERFAKVLERMGMDRFQREVVEPWLQGSHA